MMDIIAPFEKVIYIPPASSSYVQCKRISYENYYHSNKSP